MTLFEVLIVVAIMALLAGTVGVAAFKHWIEAQEETTHTSARAIRGAVKTWWLQHDQSECPGVDQLVAFGPSRGALPPARTDTLDRDGARHDAWGEAWRLECSDDDVTVISAGRDRRLGTADDIRVPPA